MDALIILLEHDFTLLSFRYQRVFLQLRLDMAEIKELEAKRAELDKEIEVYLKELGIME